MEDPLDIVDRDDDSAEEVTLAILKPFPREVALATVRSLSLPWTRKRHYQNNWKS